MPSRRRRRKCAAPDAHACALLLALLCASSAAAADAPAFWPLPALLTTGAGTLHVSPTFTLSCDDASPHCPPTLLAAFNRAIPAVLGVPSRTPTVQVGTTQQQQQQQQRQPAPLPPDDVTPTLHSCAVTVSSSEEMPSPSMDESYALSVDADGSCRVAAPAVWGAMHALTTLAQACVGTPGATRVLVGTPLRVTDAPRFPYRGLLLDTGRRYLPPATLRRTLDAMAANKLNVLHWHLVDVDSFPLALPGFTALSDAAAWHPRATYSPADISDVVEHARARGIRVIPEIDLPAHGAWGAWCLSCARAPLPPVLM
jgi:hypothetical protein